MYIIYKYIIKEKTLRYTYTIYVNTHVRTYVSHNVQIYKHTHLQFHWNKHLGIQNLILPFYVWHTSLLMVHQLDSFQIPLDSKEAILYLVVLCCEVDEMILGQNQNTGQENDSTSLAQVLYWLKYTIWLLFHMAVSPVFAFQDELVQRIHSL